MSVCFLAFASRRTGGILVEGSTYILDAMVQVRSQALGNAKSKQCGGVEEVKWLFARRDEVFRGLSDSSILALR